MRRQQAFVKSSNTCGCMRPSHWQRTVSSHWQGTASVLARHEGTRHGELCHKRLLQPVEGRQRLCRATTSIRRSCRQIWALVAQESAFEIGPAHSKGSVRLRARASPYPLRITPSTTLGCGLMLRAPRRCEGTLSIATHDVTGWMCCQSRRRGRISHRVRVGTGRLAWLDPGSIVCEEPQPPEAIVTSSNELSFKSEPRLDEPPRIYHSCSFQPVCA